MSREKVARIPISSTRRMRNRKGKLGVACMVSDRWLKFEPTSHKFADGESLDVMTVEMETERPRKLCSRVVLREDLERALGNIEVAES